MKKNLLIFSALILPLAISAQIPITFNINTNLDRKPISPYIYGSNGQSADEDENITARRIGGNRLTGYNWENNFSNAGTDYLNHSDDYLPWVMNLPSNQYLQPNAVYKAFHDTSLSMNCYSLITLPMAGYVSRDGNGTVTHAAPSGRWRKVVNQKGSAFQLIPDTADGNIYIDECLNNLISQYGKSNTSTGIKGYSMDNEWSLWSSTHPMIHPNQPTIAEVISKATDLSTAIKTMDSTADVFGPADYGYASFLKFQDAQDWSTYSSYGNFAGAFLHGMKLASTNAGRRLLDVYDAHWYPEAQGYNGSSWMRVALNNDSSRGVAEARMQAPRTLWDSSYVENSWIGQYYSSCVYIHALQHSIDLYNPGTKLAFTEYNYGGETHISGGIAIADVLGIFGKYGVYMGNYWDPIDGFISSAYKIYRNYDDNNHTFGDMHVSATANNYRATSIYASLNSTDTTEMHIIAMNKNYDSTLVANFSINANSVFHYAQIYAFNRANTTIQYMGSLNNITGNQFNYSLPPLSAYHFVLTNTLTSTTELNNENKEEKISSNPTTGKFSIENLQENLPGSLVINNVMGEILLTSWVINPKSEIDLSSQPDGIYFLNFSNSQMNFTSKIVIQH